MKDTGAIDFSKFDREEILSFLFYPRKEQGWQRGDGVFDELTIPAADGMIIGGRFYEAGAASPTMLFFHGNGEIVADYEDLAPFFLKLGANFLPVDYRGYGKSTGSPTVTGMMRDCHFIFDFVKNYLKEKGFGGPVVVMGRSLGSASALELASSYPSEVAGLIIESGFAFIVPLMKLLGIRPSMIGVTDESAFAHTAKIAAYAGPLLVIHAENDHIIPFSDGRALFEASASREKRFLEILHANHNNIFQFGMREYLDAVRDLLAKAGR